MECLVCVRECWNKQSIWNSNINTFYCTGRLPVWYENSLKVSNTKIGFQFDKIFSFSVVHDCSVRSLCYFWCISHTERNIFQSKINEFMNHAHFQFNNFRAKNGREKKLFIYGEKEFITQSFVNSKASGHQAYNPRPSDHIWPTPIFISRDSFPIATYAFVFCVLCSVFCVPMLTVNTNLWLHFIIDKFYFKHCLVMCALCEYGWCQQKVN